MAKSRLDAYSRQLDDTPSHPKAASGHKEDAKSETRNPKQIQNRKFECP
jgi:hypothetical protein